MAVCHPLDLIFRICPCEGLKRTAALGGLQFLGAKQPVAFDLPWEAARSESAKER